MVYKEAFAARTIINGQIKAHSIPTGDTSMAGDVSEVRVKLAEYEQQRQRIHQQQQEADGAITRYDFNLTSLNDQKQAANVRLSSEQQQVDVVKRRVLSKAVLKDRTDLAAKKPRALELDTQIALQQAQYLENEEAFKHVQNLERSPNCPKCRQPITEEIVGVIAKPIIEKRNTLDDSLRELRKERQSIGDYEGAAQEIAKHEQAKVDLKRAEERVEEAHGEIAKLTKQIEGMGARPTVSEEHTEALAEIAQWIQQAQERIEPIAKANALKDAIAAAKERGEALAKKSQAIEKIVAYFGPGKDGIQTKMLSQYVGGFEQSMNEVLANWGYECALQFEPYVFGVKRGGAMLPLNVLSGSEKHQFVIAFQIALAIHTGLLFAVVDSSDIYDTEQRKKMFNALLNSGLDQVIVLGTDQRTEVPDNQDEKGMAYYSFTSENATDVFTTTVKRMLPALA
jgi:hypothetical protein